MRIVLDTNVVVSGLLKTSGVSARVLKLAQEGVVVTLLYNDRIIAEYLEVSRSVAVVAAVVVT